MKLNIRFILISFVIVLCVSVASTFIFYSLAGKVLTQQQTKTVLNSTNDLVITLANELQETDDDFRSLVPKLNNFPSIDLDSTSIDFLFTLVNDSLINNREFKVRTKSYLNIRSSSFRQFFNDNPNVILRYSQLSSGKTVYYGRLLSAEVLTKMAEKIRSEVALVINDSPVEVSNQEKNQSLLLNVMKAVHDLRYKNNYDLYIAELDHADFIASLFTPRFLLTPGAKIDFIVFQAFKEGVEFRETTRIVMILIVLAGSALTFIAVFLFTAKLRRQIVLLSQGAEITGKGNLMHRVPIITKDEIGHFGETFNNMLDELVRNKRAEQEYSEFITLINQNPTLTEIADAALSKIIKTTGLTFGALYTVSNKKIRLISSYGINRDLVKPTKDPDLYTNAIEKKEKIEFHFHENHPEIKTGIATIKIEYLMIYPIMYNKETIAVLELASEATPKSEISSYIDNIHEQLAIGLVNANSFEQLENLVYELEKLNEEYQKQNKQTIEQNLELRELHRQLQEKAEELEKQRSKAVELTQVKSEFLASMSHELRTPLISILGLTELLLKESENSKRAKERLAIVHRNGKKLLTLINNILEFSKFETGKIEIKKEKFLLGDLLDDVNVNISQLAAEKDLKFIIEMKQNVNLLLDSDRGKLEQILMNLLVNAVKFTDDGEVKLVVKQLNETDLQFAVVDTGIGISEEDKKIVFEEFRQVDSGSSRKYSGAGLGLAICKKYAELLGTALRLKSELGRGSEFSFILTNSIMQKIENIPHRFLSIESNKEENFKGVLLIVDDNIDSQKLTGDYFRSYNFKIFTAQTKKDSLRLTAEKNPGSIIINPASKEISAWELISELKNDPSTKGIQILLAVILDEEKIGWRPEIFDFCSDKITGEELKSKIDELERTVNRNIKKIFILDKSKQSFESLANNPGGNRQIIRETNWNKLLKEITSDEEQLLVMDLASFGPDIFRYCYELRSRKPEAKVFMIVKLPADTTKKLSKELNAVVKNLAEAVKAHPLDILKSLRDTIGIYEDESKPAVSAKDEKAGASIIDSPQDLIWKKHDYKPTVLIVDDDNDALFTVGEFIKEMNCDAVFAHNGMECLLTLNHVNPDLILLDIMMPQMDGFETIGRIRSEEKFNAIPVVALTAYAMLDNKEVIEKSGFNDIVTKPINSQSLAGILKKYLKVESI